MSLGACHRWSSSCTFFPRRGLCFFPLPRKRKSFLPVFFTLQAMPSYFYSQCEHFFISTSGVLSRYKDPCDRSTFTSVVFLWEDSLSGTELAAMSSSVISVKFTIFELSLVPSEGPAVIVASYPCFSTDSFAIPFASSSKFSDDYSWVSLSVMGCIPRGFSD